MSEVEHEDVKSGEGLDYRTIARIMSKNGFVMNHSSVRNYVIRTMKKIIAVVARQHKFKLNEKMVDELASSSSFQSTVAQVLQEDRARTQRE